VAVVCTPAVVDGPRGDLSDLCGHSAEQFAEVALILEPRGVAWCKDFGTIKAALYRAFGALLSGFERRLCYLFTESLGCSAVELLSEFETDYGLPGDCAFGAYPKDVAGRQARVCAARKGSSVGTNAELQAVLRTAMQCDWLTVTNVSQHSVAGMLAGMPLMVSTGVCIGGVGTTYTPPSVHFVSGNVAGLPLTNYDRNFSPTDECPIFEHVVAGFSVGSPLTTGATNQVELLSCLMTKYLPAHISWTFCQ